MKKQIGIIGLGKMGGNIAGRLHRKGWKVVGLDPAEEVRAKMKAAGVTTTDTAQKLAESLSTPRIIWLMVTARGAKGSSRKPIDDALFGSGGIVQHLQKGDIVIDAGNSYFKDTIARGKKLAKQKIRFIDVGFSGGPSGAKNGGCLMIGGDERAFRELEPLFRDLAVEEGYQFFKGVGAGHFVKMVHNGIEYGMMQAIAEGFAIMKKSKYRPDLTRVANIYNHKSVVESRLVGWLESAFKEYGENLAGMAGTVGHLGEGEWTVKTAKEMKVPAKIIEESFKFRLKSAKNPSYTGKILSALREQFGGKRTKTS